MNRRCAVALGTAVLVAAGLVAAPTASAAECPPGYVVATNSQTGFRLCIQMAPGAGLPSPSAPSAPTTSAPRSSGSATT